MAGKPKGLIEGGILEQKMREVEIKCLPDRIPEFIEADVSGLDVGDNLHLADVIIPEGIKVVTDLTRTVAVVTVVKEESAAPAEGAEAAAETPAAAPAAAAKEKPAK